MVSCYQLLEQAAATRPKQIALIDEYGPLNYGDLLQQTERLKTVLFHEGVDPSMAVVVMGRNGRGFIMAMLAVMGCGAVAVPLSHQLKATEIVQIIQGTGAQAIIDDQSSAAPWPGASNGIALASQTLRLIWTQVPGNPALGQLPDAAFIRYTSGTTGTNKGVVLTHQSILARVENAVRSLRLGGDDAVLWVLPMAFHFLVSILVYIRSGARIIISKDLYAQSLIEAANRHRATVLYAAPMHFKLLAADSSGQSLSSLTTAISTSSAIQLDIAEAFRRRFGIPVSQAYGIIEAGLPLLDNLSGTTDPKTVGYPANGFSIALLDANDRPVAEGQIGKLALRGPGMFDAYLQPWQTSSQIMQNGWFMTGDLAVRCGDGRITVCGREKSVINVAGNKAFPEEIEAVLNKHPNIAASRVFGRPHPLMGEVVCAQVQLIKQAEYNSETIFRFCRSQLSAYKIPQHLEVVDRIMQTPSGKIKRVDEQSESD